MLQVWTDASGLKKAIVCNSIIIIIIVLLVKYM